MADIENTPETTLIQADSAVKPPPIIVQMESIAPEPIVMGGGINLKHDWYRLLNSAPFQMYCCETFAQEGQGSHNVEKWIVPYIEQMILDKGEDDLFQRFSDWHGAKGCWKNETVYGDLIEEAQ